jgi:FixJ family two-component response regulator
LFSIAENRLIIITGRDDFAVGSIATQVGAIFLLKPFEDADFLDKVQSALTDRGSR